jgi:riboflavin kinase/FMN adenylyltransferase
MDIFTDNDTISNSYKDSVIIIGNFDGMHQGHIALIKAAINDARANNKPVGLLTFEPHPRTLFQPNESPFRITPKGIKREKIENAGLDFLIELNFTRELAQKSADAFVQDILVNQIGAAHVFIGKDFRFGQNRSGSSDTIKSHGLSVTSVPIVNDAHHQKYSASQVRSNLRRGMITEANATLGWDWEVRGQVVHGDKRGREMGFPTANVPLAETLHPAFGVYATFVQIDGDDTWYPAATNIGIRPMFETDNALVEAHILNYNSDLYGKELRIRPVQKIRDEVKYTSLEALIIQIEKDCDAIKHILSLEKAS